GGASCGRTRRVDASYGMPRGKFQPPGVPRRHRANAPRERRSALYYNDLQSIPEPAQMARGGSGGCHARSGGCTARGGKSAQFSV
ncbi:MAG: hypothetical protein AVDCRST_MAG68-3874, partial [uncultured Gemmatimonadetes bacterium]